MNTPSQTLICNPQIDRSELLSVSFQPFHVSSHLPCLCECVHLIVKNAKAVRWGKKENKTHTQLPGFGLALLRQLLASRAGNLTKQLKKQNTCARSVSSLNIMSQSRNPRGCKYKYRQKETVKLTVQTFLQKKLK